MNISIRTQLIIGAASLLCLLLVGLSLLLLRQIGPSPASLLPADRTLILIENVQPEVREALGTIIPFLNTIPPYRGTTAALVRLPDGKTDWLIFGETKDARGGKSIGSENPMTFALLGTGSALSADPGFLALAHNYKPGPSWIYVQNPAMQMMVQGLQLPSVPLSLELGTGSLRLAWPSRMTTAFTGPVMGEDGNAIVRLNAATLSLFLKNAASIFTDAVRMPAEALLQSWISRTVGKDISMTYDIVPMLDGPGIVTIAAASETLDAGVRALPSESAENKLQRLEQEAIGASADVEQVERKFDEKFTLETIQAKTNMIPVETEQSGWTIRTIASDKFVTARKGREFIVATGDALLNALLAATLGNAHQQIADGMIRENAVTDLLRQWHIPLHLPWNLIPGTGDTIMWTMNRQGGLAVLDMQRSE